MVAIIGMIIGIVLVIPAYNEAREPILGIFLATGVVAISTAIGVMLDGYLHEEKKHH